MYRALKIRASYTEAIRRMHTVWETERLKRSLCGQSPALLQDDAYFAFRCVGQVQWRRVLFTAKRFPK